jgi:hypothetical protein
VDSEDSVLKRKRGDDCLEEDGDDDNREDTTMAVNYAGLLDSETEGDDEDNSEDEQEEEVLDDVYAKYGISANAGK